ncbi:MAG: hypothetical protein QXX95_06840 [Nitrososphaerales archaeon]
MNLELNLTHIVSKLNDELAQFEKEWDERNLELKAYQLVFEDKDDLTPYFNSDEKVDMQHVNTINLKAWIGAVDSTCILLATTNKGLLFAFRACVVLSYSGKPRAFLRLGPYLIHLNSNNLDNMNYLLSLNGEKNLMNQVIRIRIERILQKLLATNLKNSLILIDGSLRYSVVEPKPFNLKDIIEISKERDNHIIAISKKTIIKNIQNLTSKLFECKDAPLIIPLSLNGEVSLGHITITKFTRDGIPLRVDYQNSLKLALSMLLSNDSFNFGYPESLSLAHRLSIFNALEISSLKCYVKAKGAIEVPSYNFRTLVL